MCCATSGLGSLRVDNMLQNKPPVASSDCAGSEPTPVNTCISNTWASLSRSSARAPHLSYNHHLLPSLHSCQLSPFHSMPAKCSRVSLHTLPLSPASALQKPPPGHSLHHSYQRCQFSPPGSSVSRQALL